MASMAFDTLRYARRLKEVGVPEPQADVQAELMAEAFGFYAENLLTRDHFTEVLNARFSELIALMDKRFAAQDARIEQRFAEQTSYLDKRLAAQDMRIEQGFAEQDKRIEQGFAEQNRRFEQGFAAVDKRFAEQDKRFVAIETRLDSLEDRMDRIEVCIRDLTRLTTRIERTQYVHSWVLAVGVASLLIPQVSAWIA